MGGNHRPATPKDRALGAELRAIRQEAGLSLADVCRVIDWQESTLSRLERGHRKISPEAVMGLAVVYRLPSGRRDELVARAKELPAVGWWDRQVPGVPADTGALASFEHEAIRITNWSPGLIPGLLQTQEYTMALMLDREVSEKEVHARLRARRQRQEVLQRRNVDYTALIGAAALRNQLGDTQVFAAQLRHLVRMGDRRVSLCASLINRLPWWSATGI
ncbi:Scr1 family TA system antitoxin-like transcriptional regulator [Actinokineospora auranticolor]|uniref:Helix-turn-helix protein n=1 Tax=Actinokineospora auranticolor TaxID=155976 RepID=A0A2S6GHQ9_9PSEU|nr:Scr1 family TA system antitoxin-like transcriptional regulator [Actinokineospora auranticolor]PPK64733.1 helix-turn-helix protein [Actinokineospora auranticolor]